MVPAPNSFSGQLENIGNFFLVERLFAPIYPGADTTYRIKLCLNDRAITEDIRFTDTLPDTACSEMIRAKIRAMCQELAQQLTMFFDNHHRITGRLDTTIQVTTPPPAVDWELPNRMGTLFAETVSQRETQMLMQTYQAQVNLYRAQIDAQVNLYRAQIDNAVRAINPRWEGHRLWRQVRLTTQAPTPKSILHKSMLILLKNIGWKKFRQFRKVGYFEEPCKYGTLRFMSRDGGGIKLIENKKYGTIERMLEWNLCIQSTSPGLPHGDVVLSRWLAFKADENSFFDTCNFRSVDTVDEAVIRVAPRFATRGNRLQDDLYYVVSQSFSVSPSEEAL